MAGARGCLQLRHYSSSELVVPLIGSLCCSHTGHPPQSSALRPDVFNSQFKRLSQRVRGAPVTSMLSTAALGKFVLFSFRILSTLPSDCSGVCLLAYTHLCHRPTLASKNTGLLHGFTFWYQGRRLAQSRGSLHERKREGVGGGKEERQT